jgi:hypothetical protein
MPVSQFPEAYAVIVLRQEGQTSVCGERLLCFFDLESEDCLAYHDFTLLVKGFACRQSLYTRSLSGQQGFFIAQRYFYRGIRVVDLVRSTAGLTPSCDVEILRRARVPCCFASSRA